VPTVTKTPTVGQDAPALESSGFPLEYVAFNHLLEQHPRRLTLAQLGREIGAGQAALKRVIANLHEVFLVQHQDRELVPSPLALRFDRAPHEAVGPPRGSA